MLRSCLRSWQRSSVFLTCRITVAQSIASERASLASQRERLDRDAETALDYEKQRLAVDAMATLQRAEDTLAASFASKLASSEQSLLASHLVMQASNSLDGEAVLSMAEAQLRNSSKLLGDSDVRLQAEAKARASAEAKADAAESKCASLLDAFFVLHGLVSDLSSSNSSLHGQLRGLTSQVFDRAGSTAAASRVRALSRAGATSPDGCLDAERRRRSHLASPSVHAVPSSSFHFASGILPTSRVNSGSDNVTGTTTRGGSPSPSPSPSPTAGNGKHVAMLKQKGRSSPALLESKGQQDDGGGGRGGDDDDDDDDDPAAETFGKKPAALLAKKQLAVPTPGRLTHVKEEEDDDGESDLQPPRSSAFPPPPSLHKTASEQAPKRGSLPALSRSNSSVAAALSSVVSRNVKPSKSSSRGGPRHSHDVTKEGEEMWRQIQTPAKASNNVAVAVRVRPLNQRELDLRSDVCVVIKDDSCALVEPTSGEKMTFTFDYCFDTMDPAKSESYADQTVVFSRLGVDILRNAWQGYNACLFAYGQTGSGKSWSITGSKENPGIIPQFCDKLFYFIEHHCPAGATYTVEASYLEIYNERVQDLLNPDGANLKVREHPITGVFVEGLSYCAVDCYEDVEELMDQGTAARTIGATNMNASSSRSHSIFEMIITQETKGGGGSTEMQSRVVLIDLAGSERASSTGATGSRLKEGAQINKSLSELGACIRALAESSGKKNASEHLIPFRNSVLTMLLKNSLIGNAKTTMLAAISPADANYGETLGTLRYAQSAKKIATKPVVNEDPTAKLIKELKAEVMRLKNELTVGAAVATGEDQVSLNSNIGGAIQEVEAMMLEASMSKAAKRQQSERLKTRRRLTLAMTGGVKDSADKDAYKQIAHLSNLNEDTLLSGTLKLVISNGTQMKLGRKDASIPQDVQLEGLGMKKQHCVIENKEGHRHLYLTVAEETADVYVNGHKLSFVSPPHKLKNRDVLVLGVCTHIFQVVIPPPHDAAQSHEIPDDSEEVVSYNEAIRQVMMGRPETQHQKEMRLARMVLANWRRPVFRRLFEERLVQALRYCSEANEIARQMQVSTKFVLNLSCAVHLDDAPSLSLREIIKYEHVRIMIKVMNFDEPTFQLDAGGEPEEPKMVCECHRGEFSLFLDQLRNEYNMMRGLCTHVTGEAGHRQKTVVSELFSADSQETTVADIKFRILGMTPHDIEAREGVLNSTLNNFCDLGWDDSTKVDEDEAEGIIKALLEKAFDNVLSPLVEECSPYGVLSSISEADIEQYESQFSSIVQSESAATAKFFGDVNKEFEALNALIGSAVFAPLTTGHAHHQHHNHNQRPAAFSPAPAVDERRSESWKGGEDEEEEVEEEGMQVEGEAFEALDEGDEVQDEEEDEPGGGGGGSADDWELVHDDATETDYWWSESRQVSKWATDGDGPGASPVLGQAAGSTAPSGVDEGVEGNLSPLQSSQPEPVATSAAAVAAAATPPILPDPVAMLYGGPLGLSRAHSDTGSFDENPTPDERLHTYEDEEDERLRRTLQKGGVVGLEAAQALARKIQVAAAERELEEKEKEREGGEEQRVEDEDEEDGGGSDRSSVDDWFIVHDEVSGRDYWWSDSREEAQWVDEIEDGAEDPHIYFANHHHHHDMKDKKKKSNHKASLLRRKSMEGEAWELHTDDSGRQYLYNQATGKSKWHEK